jgi:hypothetical protein
VPLTAAQVGGTFFVYVLRRRVGDVVFFLAICIDAIHACTPTLFISRRSHPFLLREVAVPEKRLGPLLLLNTQLVARRSTFSAGIVA